MQTLDPVELAEHEKRLGTISRTLFWVAAKNRTTGLPESVGLWDGDDVQNFTIDGDVRTYFGPSIMEVPVITGGVGLDVRQISVKVPHLSPEVQNMLRLYDPRLAPVEMHRAVYSLETNNLIGLRRIFKGWITKAPITTGADGQDGAAEISLVSASRSLTRRLALYRSNADQVARLSTDRGREYGSTSGLKEVWWGEGKVTNQPRLAVTNVNTTDQSTWGP
ncbi:hypothetical protein [Acidiphilium sp.]|uniref:hypothetical protein n=1 Tax=Acidiphilium sp. TaxID=527 RepID=UPI002585E262|nr:hypothetical protein [Acidiphilium sp.]